MTNIDQLYNNAQLALAAYAPLTKGEIGPVHLAVTPARTLSQVALATTRSPAQEETIASCLTVHWTAA